jgi:hypothetical protein
MTSDPQRNGSADAPPRILFTDGHWQASCRSAAGLRSNPDVLAPGVDSMPPPFGAGSAKTPAARFQDCHRKLA